MRDLTSRLRAIVQQDVKRLRPHVSAESPELETGIDRSCAGNLDELAAALGGVRHDVDGSTCIAIDRVWTFDEWHGRRRVEHYRLDAAAPIAIFDRRLASVPDWASRVVFFDIETTGLSGGAGTLPLLAACGWFEDDGFRVRQFFLGGPAGEHALLDALTTIFEGASLLVTYNGRTFDVPVMETRYAFHRRSDPSDGLAHFDMLPTARRLWGRREGEGCTLTAIERSVLRFHRLDDVPGMEIPSRYFQFLRTGDPRLIEGVLDHNRHDVLSLAAVTARALRLLIDGPGECETAGEQLGLGRAYEGAGDLPRAEQAYAAAGASDDADLAAQALSRLAVLLRRSDRHHDAAAAWQGVLALSASEPRLAALERRAAEALAVHHEHRARDLGKAHAYAAALRAQSIGRQVEDVNRRLGRLDRKIEQAKKERGSPQAAPLLE